MPKKSTQPQQPVAATGVTDLKSLIADTRNKADSEVLLHEVLEAWGGPVQLARDLHAEFHAAGPGSMTRQRILEMIQRLIVSNTKDDLGRPSNPSDLSDDELAATALGLLSKAKPNAVAGPGTP